MSSDARNDRFVPALRFRWLTPLFDPLAAVTTRERHFKGRVLDRAEVRDGERVLDLACGTGTLASTCSSAPREPT